MYNLPPILSERPGRRTLSPMDPCRLSPSGRRLLDTTVLQLGRFSPADIQHEIDLLESEIGQLTGQKATVSGRGKRDKFDLSAVKASTVCEGLTGSCRPKSRSKSDSGQNQSNRGESQSHSAGLTTNQAQAAPRSVEPTGAITMTNRSV